ncbi:hypothetical protein Tco_1393381, partial [Tanacetum coccineum]
MNDMMNPRRRGYCNGRRSEGEESENPFFKGGGSSSDNPFVVLGVEEESMPVYDTDIEDVIEEKEGSVGKGWYGGEEEHARPRS